MSKARRRTAQTKQQRAAAEQRDKLRQWCEQENTRKQVAGDLPYLLIEARRYAKAVRANHAGRLKAVEAVAARERDAESHEVKTVNRLLKLERLAVRIIEQADAMQQAVNNGDIEQVGCIGVEVGGLVHRLRWEDTSIDELLGWSRGRVMAWRGVLVDITDASEKQVAFLQQAREHHAIGSPLPPTSAPPAYLSSASKR